MHPLLDKNVGPPDDNENKENDKGHGATTMPKTTKTRAPTKNWRELRFAGLASESGLSGRSPGTTPKK